MLSFLKLLQNWPRNTVLNWAFCCGAVWRRMQRKPVIWVHNYSPSGVQLPQSYLGKFTSCMTFGAHKLVRSEPFRRKIQRDWNSWKCERLHNSDDKNMEMWLAMLKAVRCASLQKFRITCDNVGLINLFGGVWIMKVPSISVNLLELIL